MVAWLRHVGAPVDLVLVVRRPVDARQVGGQTEIGIQDSLLDAGDRALIAHLQHNIATVSAMDSMPTVESADGGFCLDHDDLEAPRQQSH